MKLVTLNENHEPIDLKVDVAAKLAEIMAKKGNQIQEETIMAKETNVTYEIKSGNVKDAIEIVKKIKEAHRESHDVLDIKVTTH